MKCVVSIWALPLRGEGCKGLPGWFGALNFSTFSCLTEGGGEGGLKLFGQYPYRTNTFQKGASRSWSASKKLTQIYHEKFKRCELCGESPHNCCDTSAGEDGHRNSPLHILLDS